MAERKHGGEVVEPGALARRPISAEERLLTGLGLEHFQIEGTVAVTRPVLKQADGVPVAVQVISRIHKSPRFADEFPDEKPDSEKEKPKGDDAPPTEPPHVFFVINLQTGEEQTMIANAALRSALERTYPRFGYLTKCFGIISRKVQHKGTKSIREYMVRELKIAEASRVNLASPDLLKQIEASLPAPPQATPNS